MKTRLATLVTMVLLGVALAGCTRCGFIWDDWKPKPKSCRGDAPVN